MNSLEIIILYIISLKDKIVEIIINGNCKMVKIKYIHKYTLICIQVIMKMYLILYQMFLVLIEEHFNYLVFI